MAVKSSTGFNNKLLDTSAVRTFMNLGFIKIYSGTAPLSADDALGSMGTNTLLCTISNNSTGTGLTLEATAASRQIAKTSSETWSGVNAATGTATFYRHVAAGDDGTSSTTQARLQGTVGTVGTDMLLSSTSLTSGQTQTLQYYFISAPTG